MPPALVEENDIYSCPAIGRFDELTLNLHAGESKFLHSST